MTPEEKAAAKKAKAAKKQKELAGQQGKSIDQPPRHAGGNQPLKAAKAQPKALPDAKAHQEAETKQEKAAVKGGGGN